VDAEHEAVVANFLHNFTTPDESLFDKLITIGVEDDQRTALGKAVDGLVEVLGLKRPSEDEIDKALQAAQTYKVTTPFHGIARMGKPVRYFGLAPEIDLDEVVGDALKSPMPQAAADSARAFMTSLREKKRITPRPHITLSHEKNVKVEQEAGGEGASAGPHAKAWATCKTLAEQGISPIYDFDVTHLAWDDRVMALVVNNIRPQSDKEEDGRGAGLELVLPEEVQINLHVTVGTQSEDISAFESRSVVRAAREAIARGQSTGEGGEAVEGGGPVHWVAVGPLQGTGRIRGMY
jgi:tRNA ligase